MSLHRFEHRAATKMKMKTKTKLTLEQAERIFEAAKFFIKSRDSGVGEVFAIERLREIVFATSVALEEKP